MAGIERINITNELSGGGAWRFWESKRRWLVAHRIYRIVFPTLLADCEFIECSQEDFDAGYDRSLGIDVFLNFQSGMAATLQEKFLYTKWKTVTVEYMQNRFTDEPGDWFNMRTQYYFVGYDRGHLDCSTRDGQNKSRVDFEKELNTGACSICKQPFTFQDWILLDWPATQRETARGNIRWRLRDNGRDGALSSFRWAFFGDFPMACIVASSELRESLVTQGRLL
jgi:hypothetical protein